MANCHAMATSDSGSSPQEERPPADGAPLQLEQQQQQQQEVHDQIIAPVNATPCGSQPPAVDDTGADGAAGDGGADADRQVSVVQDFGTRQGSSALYETAAQDPAALKQLIAALQTAQQRQVLNSKAEAESQKRLAQAMRDKLEAERRERCAAQQELQARSAELTALQRGIAEIREHFRLQAKRNSFRMLNLVNQKALDDDVSKNEVAAFVGELLDREVDDITMPDGDNVLMQDMTKEEKLLRRMAGMQHTITALEKECMVNTPLLAHWNKIKEGPMRRTLTMARAFVKDLLKTHATVRESIREFRKDPFLPGLAAEELVAAGVDWHVLVAPRVSTMESTLVRRQEQVGSDRYAARMEQVEQECRAQVAQSRAQLERAQQYSLKLTADLRASQRQLEQSQRELGAALAMLNAAGNSASTPPFAPAAAPPAAPEDVDTGSFGAALPKPGKPRKSAALGDGKAVQKGAVKRVPSRRKPGNTDASPRSAGARKNIASPTAAAQPAVLVSRTADSDSGDSDPQEGPMPFLSPSVAEIAEAGAVRCRWVQALLAASSISAERELPADPGEATGLEEAGPAAGAPPASEAAAAATAAPAAGSLPERVAPVEAVVATPLVATVTAAHILQAAVPKADAGCQTDARPASSSSEDSAPQPRRPRHRPRHGQAPDTLHLGKQTLQRDQRPQQQQQQQVTSEQQDRGRPGPLLDASEMSQDVRILLKQHLAQQYHAPLVVQWAGQQQAPLLHQQPMSVVEQPQLARYQLDYAAEEQRLLQYEGQPRKLDPAGLPPIRAIPAADTAHSGTPATRSAGGISWEKMQCGIPPPLSVGDLLDDPALTVQERLVRALRRERIASSDFVLQQTRPRVLPAAPTAPSPKQCPAPGDSNQQPTTPHRRRQPQLSATTRRSVAPTSAGTRRSVANETAQPGAVFTPRLPPLRRGSHVAADLTSTSKAPVVEGAAAVLTVAGTAASKASSRELPSLAASRRSLVATSPGDGSAGDELAVQSPAPQPAPQPTNRPGRRGSAAAAPAAPQLSATQRLLCTRAELLHDELSRFLGNLATWLALRGKLSAALPAPRESAAQQGGGERDRVAAGHLAADVDLVSAFHYAVLGERAKQYRGRLNMRLVPLSVTLRRLSQKIIEHPGTSELQISVIATVRCRLERQVARLHELKRSIEEHQESMQRKAQRKAHRQQPA
eukprot:TRINITY_DN8362_c2_g1_i4.p1 TRINITY_DN8362_c2_g1~~TRINITY_DN8362_c2_g1_i4.p1  ORF type:complete len:1190 (+),score=226.15 TRINITY_DN8362_c2_g1_i4:42-3611(+)